MYLRCTTATCPAPASRASRETANLFICDASIIMSEHAKSFLLIPCQVNIPVFDSLPHDSARRRRRGKRCPGNTHSYRVSRARAGRSSAGAMKYSNLRRGSEWQESFCENLSRWPLRLRVAGSELDLHDVMRERTGGPSATRDGA